MRTRFLIRTAALDLVALVVSFFVASLVVFDQLVPWVARPRIFPLLWFMIVGMAAGSYVSARTWGNGAPRPSYGRAVYIGVNVVAVTSLLLVVFREAYFSRWFVAVTTVSWLVIAMSHRAFSRSRPWSEPMVIVTKEKGLVDDLQGAATADVVIALDPAAVAPESPIPEGAVLVLDLRSVLSDEMAQFVSSSSIAGYQVRALGNVYEEHTGRMAIVHLAEGWELSAPVSRNRGYEPVKRVTEVILTLATAPLWLILAGIIWVAVRIDSPGPAVYHQERVGLMGKPFTLHKFRTMVNGADVDGPRFARPDDDRLTRAGKILRRFRIDEIPQLWNVIKGDLSLVGPRPEQVGFVKDFERSIPFYGFRHLIRPGVTGWAQVNYGYADDEADTIEKLTYDLYYVKHMSPWLDLGILGQSIWTVISGFGAR
ncbi:MAG: sugar transferase [Acidimicrobiia bacterium]